MITRARSAVSLWGIQKVIFVIAAMSTARADATTGMPGYLGVVYPQMSAAVSAEVPGVVTRVSVHLGDQVIAGDTLVSLEAPELRLAHEQSRSALDAAEWNMLAAKIEFDSVSRRVELWKKTTDVFSEEEIAALELRRAVAEAAYRAALATVEERRKEVHLRERDLESLNIRAPFSGSVRGLRCDVGERVTAGDVIVNLIADADLRVRFAIPLSAFRGLERGSQVRIVVGMGEPDVLGSVLQIASEADPEIDMIVVEAKLSDGSLHELWPGQVVRVFPLGKGPQSK